MVWKYERKRTLARTRRKWRTLEVLFEVGDCICFWWIKSVQQWMNVVNTMGHFRFSRTSLETSWDARVEWSCWSCWRSCVFLSLNVTGTQTNKQREPCVWDLQQLAGTDITGSRQMAVMRIWALRIWNRGFGTRFQHHSIYIHVFFWHHYYM